MKKASLLLLLLGAATIVSAQQKSSTLEQLERQMLEMQRQLLQEFQNNPFGGGLFAFPGKDSSYTFRFDTTFTGDNFSGSFHFSPFSGDSTQSNDFQGFEWLRNQIFGDGQQGDFWGQGQPQDQADEVPPGTENLLPEERLRLEEEQQSERGTPKGDKPTTKPKPAKSTIKTIRI